MPHLIYPSILSADFDNLEKVCALINSSEADGFHLDVMDGSFVPNISFGFPIIKAIQKHAKKPLDVHLMIVHPERYLERFKDAGADILTIHYEENNSLPETIEKIKKFGMKPCIAINPLTQVPLLKDIVCDIDSVCIMSVNPGFGGQTFIENTFSKITELKEIIRKKNTKTLIKVDGGIDLSNYSRLITSGVDILIAGSSVFGASDPMKAIGKLKNIY